MSPRPKRMSEVVSDDAYRGMLAAQGGGCAVCGSTPKTRRLHIDHDHATGRIRGLLCMQCNRFLAAYHATPAKLRAAADYLERTPR